MIQAQQPRHAKEALSVPENYKARSQSPAHREKQPPIKATIVLPPSSQQRPYVAPDQPTMPPTHLPRTAHHSAPPHIENHYASRELDTRPASFKQDTRQAPYHVADTEWGNSVESEYPCYSPYRYETREREWEPQDRHGVYPGHESHTGRHRETQWGRERSRETRRGRVEEYLPPHSPSVFNTRVRVRENDTQSDWGKGYRDWPPSPPPHTSRLQRHRS